MKSSVSGKMFTAGMSLRFLQAPSEQDILTSRSDEADNACIFVKEKLGIAASKLTETNMACRFNKAG